MKKNQKNQKKKNSHLNAPHSDLSNVFALFRQFQSSTVNLIFCCLPYFSVRFSVCIVLYCILFLFTIFLLVFCFFNYTFCLLCLFPFFLFLSSHTTSSKWDISSDIETSLIFPLGNFTVKSADKIIS
jgi:hypothetical protein